MKKWLLLMTFLFGLCPMTWGSTQDQTWPSESEETQWNPLSYKFIKFALFDFEEFLKDSLEVETQSCQYTSLRKNKTFTYSETGACIYRLLLDSASSKEPQSSVYIWAKTTENKIIQVKLDWRPQLNNIVEVLNQILEMSFEKQIISVRKYASKLLNIDFEKIGYGSRTSLMGQISLTIKNDSETVKNFMKLFSTNLAEHFQMDKISFDFQPNGRLKGYMNQKLNVKVWPAQNTDSMYFQLTTNLNILDPSRTFIVMPLKPRKPYETN